MNHLLYLDELKLFAKSRDKLELLLKDCKLFSSSICTYMSFGLNKCATTSAMKGNFVERSDVALANDFTIQAIDVLDFYEYLGMFENEAIIVSIVTSIYKKRVKKALKSALNGRNVIMAINT